MAYKKISFFITCLSLIAFVNVNSLAGQHSFDLTDDQSNKTGYLKLSAVNQDSFYVVINNRFNDALRIASGDSIELKAEPVNIRFVKRYYMDVRHHVDVKENNVHQISTRLLQVRGEKVRSRRSSYPRIYWGSNNFIQTDPETDIYINGELAGTQYALVDSSRTFDVRLVHPEGIEKEIDITPDSDSPFSFHEKYLKPSRSTARYLSFVPGGSQFYKRQTLKALAFTAATIGGAALIMHYETQYQDQMATFNDINDQYIAANDAAEAFRLGNRAEAAYAESVDLSKTRNRLIYGTAIVYIANIVDGFLTPSIGFREDKRRVDPYLDFDPAYNQPVLRLKTDF